MDSYDTVSEASRALKEKGFVLDFNLENTCVNCAEKALRLHPEDFEVKEVHRFEGESNPADNMVLYAIESKDGMARGQLLDAYGSDASQITPELAAKLGRRQ